MTRKTIAVLLAISSGFLMSNASAQTPAPASGDVLPDAAAGQCVQVVPTPDEIFLNNTCGYRITVAACVPRNARASFLCKTDGSEDISAKVFNISIRGNIGTGFPNGAAVYQMACRSPAKPVLVAATSGKCVQP